MEEPQLDVFLTTHNHIELTIRAIESLYKYTDIPFKLTVIDDSTDEEVPIYLQRFTKEHENAQVFMPMEKILGCHQAFNIALGMTDCPIICIMVNSVTVEPHWLDSAFRIIKERKDCGIVGFKILNPHGTIQCTSVISVDERGVMLVHGKDEAGHRCTFISQVPAIGGCLFLIKRKAIKTLNGGKLDESYIGFRGWDDIDLCLSVRDKGWDVIYCGYGAAYHIDSATKRHGKENENFQAELELNRKKFLEKWDFRQ